MALTLAVFDLDHTLLTADSDYLWGVYLAHAGLVDGDAYEAENARFYAAYQAGELDIRAFLRFALAPLRRLPMAELLRHRRRFISERIVPCVAAHARTVINQHRAAGHLPLIITATNRFVTAPIAALLGVDVLIATDPAMDAGAFTGDALEPPCFRAGKLALLDRWQQRHGCAGARRVCYSDSANDLPLLQSADRAVAVDADAALDAHARSAGWDRISLRGATAPWRAGALPV